MLSHNIIILLFLSLNRQMFSPSLPPASRYFRLSSPSNRRRIPLFLTKSYSHRANPLI
ncbi:hypothetical protein MANES_01G055704v8 [Manihot esculenta]|uniref:Uncharacterized protein n=1 Tax=Manihot esculenta TaxID=3983 RepID=A0ACB7IB86_MANES|nr:hypothetical protein MANES_01G055704v8 [Manihot esculenta]